MQMRYCLQITLLALMAPAAQGQTYYPGPLIYSHYHHSSNPYTFYTPTGPSGLSSSPLVLPQRGPGSSMAPEGREHPPFRHITYKQMLEEKENPFLTAVRDMRWREEQRAEREDAGPAVLDAQAGDCESDSMRKSNPYLEFFCQVTQNDLVQRGIWYQQRKKAED